MEPLDDTMSEAEFGKSSNKIALALAQLGVDLNPTIEKLVTGILDVFSDNELEMNIAITKLHDLIFEAQIIEYTNACDYFVRQFSSHCIINDIPANIVDVDDICTTSDNSHESIISSTAEFVSILAERFVDDTALESEECSFEDRVRKVVTLYIETSFMLGLTDAKALNYSSNTTKGVHFEKLIVEVLEAIFPKVF